MRHLTFLATASVILAADFATLASANNGLLSFGNGPESVGAGGAAISLPQSAVNASANPAVLGHLNDEVDLSLGIFSPTRTLNPQGNLANPAFGDQTSRVDDYLDAALGFNKRLSPNWAVGFTLTPEGGGQTKYGASYTNPAFSEEPNSNSGILIRYGILAPAAAYSPTPSQSYGISLLLGYVDARSNHAVPNGFGGLMETAGNNQDDSALGIGVRIGALWDLGERLTIGATASSGVFYQRLDKYRDLFRGPVDLPPEAGIGVTWHATRTTDIAVEGKFIAYNAVNAFGGAPSNGGFGWQNEPVVIIGLVQRLGDAWTLRAGWNYGPTPIPDYNTFANALYPAISENHFTAGVSYALSQSWVISAAGYYSPKNSQTDPGTGDFYSQNGKGTTISLEQWGVQVGLKWKY
jgi:long-chain fatty acid transport protein